MGFSDENYERAKAFLTPLAASVEEEYVREKHMGMTIDPWVVELHGRLYSGLSGRIERELDGVYRETFGRRVVRSWDDSGVRVPQLAVENDVFYVFTHILQHFYKGGHRPAAGLRLVQAAVDVPLGVGCGEVGRSAASGRADE